MNCNFCKDNWLPRGKCPECGGREKTLDLPEENLERACLYVLNNSRRGNASLNGEQYDADTVALMRCYRDIITKAWQSGELNLITKDQK